MRRATARSLSSPAPKPLLNEPSFPAGMATHILRCKECGSYGLNEECGCGATRVPPKPPKYSPEDKYAQYRRRYKELYGENQ